MEILKSFKISVRMSGCAFFFFFIYTNFNFSTQKHYPWVVFSTHDQPISSQQYGASSLDACTNVDFRLVLRQRLWKSFKIPNWLHTPNGLWDAHQFIPFFHFLRRFHTIACYYQHNVSFCRFRVSVQIIHTGSDHRLASSYFWSKQQNGFPLSPQFATFLFSP